MRVEHVVFRALGSAPLAVRVLEDDLLEDPTRLQGWLDFSLVDYCCVDFFKALKEFLKKNRMDYSLLNDDMFSYQELLQIFERGLKRKELHSILWEMAKEVHIYAPFLRHKKDLSKEILLELEKESSRNSYLVNSVKGGRTQKLELLLSSYFDKDENEFLGLSRVVANLDFSYEILNEMPTEVNSSFLEKLISKRC